MSSEEREYVSLDVEVRQVTGKAVMVRCEDAGVDKQWVPRSLVDWDASDAEPEVGSMGALVVEEWFARKEGLC